MNQEDYEKDCGELIHLVQSTVRKWVEEKGYPLELMYPIVISAMIECSGAVLGGYVDAAEFDAAMQYAFNQLKCSAKNMMEVRDGEQKC